MKPSVGRVVIYHMNEVEYSEQYGPALAYGAQRAEKPPKRHPAIITSVVGRLQVHLMVMFDGLGAEPRTYVKNIEGESTDQSGWAWPERVLPVDDLKARV